MIKRHTFKTTAKESEQTLISLLTQLSLVWCVAEWSQRGAAHGLELSLALHLPLTPKRCLMGDTSPVRNIKPLDPAASGNEKRGKGRRSAAWKILLVRCGEHTYFWGVQMMWSVFTLVFTSHWLSLLGILRYLCWSVLRWVALLGSLAPWLKEKQTKR